MGTGREIASLHSGHTDQVIGAAFSPDASRLASFGKTARLWESSTGIALAVLHGQTDRVSALAFSPNGRLLVTGGLDGKTILWDITTGRPLRDLEKHAAEVTAIAFSPDGNLLLTGSADKTVMIWDIVDPKIEPKKIDGRMSEIRAVASSSDGSKVHVIDLNGNVYIWDIRTSRIVVASTSEADGYGLASFEFDGTYAAISGKGGALRVWDAEAARTLINLRNDNSTSVSAMLWCGQRLLIGDESGTLSVYDLRELTQSISKLVARACARERALSPRFTWMESAANPLIREVWDPEGTTRSVCE